MRRAILALLVAACSGKGGDRHPDHDEPAARAGHAADEPGDHDHGDDAPVTVHIAPEMIRDLRITTAKAAARAAGERITALGELHVDQDAYAEVAALAPARVVKIFAREGDVVKVGQALVELHSADLGAARAALAAARGRVALATRDLERKRALAADRLIAAREVIDAEAALADAEAGAQIAAAALRPLGGPGGLVLRAPVAGTIIERDVALGQLADPSRTLYRIGDLSTLWLVAHVFERDAVRVEVGATGTASFAALPGRTVTGTIAWIGREVEPSSRTIPVRLALANPDGVLRPGMSATVAIPLREPGAADTPVVAVPLAAVQRVGGGWAVFLPRGPGVFEARPVGRGRELGGEVELLGGLAAGDEVVVDGAFLLKAEADKARGEGGGHDHH